MCSRRWLYLPLIVQNIDFVQFSLLRIYRPGNHIITVLENWLQRNSRNLKLLFSFYGVQAVIEILNNDTDFLYKDSHPVSRAKLKKLNFGISELALASQISYREFPGLCIDGNGFTKLKTIDQILSEYSNTVHFDLNFPSSFSDPVKERLQQIGILPGVENVD